MVEFVVTVGAMVLGAVFYRVYLDRKAKDGKKKD